MSDEPPHRCTVQQTGQAHGQHHHLAYWKYRYFLDTWKPMIFFLNGFGKYLKSQRQSQRGLKTWEQLTSLYCTHQYSYHEGRPGTPLQQYWRPWADDSDGIRWIIWQRRPSSGRCSAAPLGELMETLYRFTNRFIISQEPVWSPRQQLHTPVSSYILIPILQHCMH